MKTCHAVAWVIEGSREAARTADPRWATHCLLDWMGVAVAGTAEPLVSVLLRTVVPGTEGAAGVLARPNRGTPWDVALVNGAAGHALDYDDTHLGLRGHPTAPVLPAVLALAERERSTGRELLAALTAGIEAECRVAAIVGPDHYAAGFHATATFGAFGAAAGCAHLLGLEDGAWQHALGLAAAHAAGLKAQFGTMAKPLQAGRAAADGVRSALLASNGFTAATDGVEAYARACHGGPTDLDAADRRLGAEPAIAEVVFKRHAACHLTHATIENAARLRREGLRPDDVGSVVATVPRTALDVCGFAAPATGLEGKFSLWLAAALGLLGDDTASPLTFTDGRVTDPDVVAMLRRVEVLEAPPDTALTWAHLRVQTHDGRVLEAACDVGVPQRDLDAREQELRAKAQALGDLVLGEGRGGALADAALAVAELDELSPLLRAARPDAIAPTSP